KQVWVDLFTGEKYQGGRVLNGVKTPLWKVPVFVKDGSIIPMTNPNNNPKEIQRDQRSFLIYPNGTTALEFPNEGTAYTKDSQYQYMWGPNLLVAPIYNGNQDEAGNSIRDGIYLPD
ncbi:TPA: hypothetical protein ACOIT7_003230, partial [Enterococcus faecalis]